MLLHFCDLHRRCCIFAHIEHVPGFLYDVAHGLSRSEDPVSLGSSEADRVAPPWTDFCMLFKLHVAPFEVGLMPFIPALL